MRHVTCCLLLMFATACQDAILPEGDPAPPVEPGETGCAEACEGCDADCVSVCEALHGTLEAPRAADWMACFSIDACDADRPRDCMDGLECDDPLLIAQHCDTVARCALGGRGWMDEAACRANPYQEASRWGCLRPERREAVADCLVGAECIELSQCLDNAICAGEASCATLLATSLTVDCHRVCDRDLRSCSADDYGACWRRCDRAARALTDEHRRAFEACSLSEVCLEPSTPAGCIAQLDCDGAALRGKRDDAVTHCDWAASVDDRAIDGWGCLGQVLKSAIGACFEGPCDAMPACLDRATRCADDPDCLSFLDAR